MLLFTLISKELKHYFNSPIAYILLVAFFSITSWLFSGPLFLHDSTEVSYFYSLIPTLLIFFIPALSMRLIAEEKRQGTMEHLQTLPITDTAIVLSKFLGSWIFIGIPILCFSFYHMMINQIGIVDWGIVLSSIIGTLLAAGSMLSIGLFFSSITQNQIIAFIITALLLLFLVFSSSFMPFLPWPLTHLLQWIDIQTHYESFLRGMITIEDTAFFVCISIASIVLTIEVLHSRHS